MYIPGATYRLQFHSGFTLNQAYDIIDYLAKLGISDIYASPLLAAKYGSMHGYDSVDPSSINPEVGTAGDFDRIYEKMKLLNLGWVQDIVPNHMSFDPQNSMIFDILENGVESQYAGYFDIDWEHPYQGLTGKVLAPFLGKFYGDALDAGELKLVYTEKGFLIDYFGKQFPVRIESYYTLLSYGLEELRQRIEPENADLLKFLGILYTIRFLPSGVYSDERYGQIQFIKKLLCELYESSSMIRNHIKHVLDHFNGNPGETNTFDFADNLLSAQNYRLAYWKVGTEEINYRRFFTVNELISLRIEKDEVFNKIHGFIFQLVDEGKIRGLRIDHIDGLHEPTLYLDKLRDKYPDAYIIVEKILELNEDLPQFWRINGTTGYDYLNYVNGLFCKAENEQAFDRIYSGFIEQEVNYHKMLLEKKKLILGRHLVGDVDNFTRLLFNIARENRHGNDFTIYGLKKAFTEFLAEFSIYRTYICEDDFREVDKAYIKGAIDRAARQLPDYLKELGFLEAILLKHNWENLNNDEQYARMHFIKRFQQITGPLMAKGFEDTFLYNYNRMISLNDVGSKPLKFGISDFEFHEFNKSRNLKWLNTMNTTATHDTKRGEDVRARLNVLSELPEEWLVVVNRWKEINSEHKKVYLDVTVPEKNDEYLLYQNIIGAFPFDQSEYPEFINRMKEYIIKAVRESKVQSSWLKPEQEYEDALVGFVESILDFSPGSPFMSEIYPFIYKISHFGIFNSLSQVLLKITSPGLPDFYQGSELWDLSLVDPDNRKPVDYTKRMKYLDSILEYEDSPLDLIPKLKEKLYDGRIKMFLINKALNARKTNKEIFDKGTYESIEITGRYKNNIIAFSRSLNGKRIITAVPRFLTEIVSEGEIPTGDVWQDTALMLPGENADYTDILTGRNITVYENTPLTNLFTDLPLALLEKK